MVWTVACDCATNAKKQGRRRDATDLVVSAGAPCGPARPLWTLPATDEGLDDATELPRESIPPAPMPAPFPMVPTPRWPHCWPYNRADLIKHNLGSATTSPCCPARGCDLENVVLWSRESRRRVMSQLESGNHGVCKFLFACSQVVLWSTYYSMPRGCLH